MIQGKVHGSLARAGKVKGQTPKVEAVEKKKQPKGRAKKRLLYNRRFVNAVVGAPGKQRVIFLFFSFSFFNFEITIFVDILPNIFNG